MSRLFLLNVLLLAGIAYATLRLSDLMEETARRQEMVGAGAPSFPKAKPTTPVPPPERTVAANYLDIATRLLFSKDRNPTVIIAPPPVKQVPAFPVSYGVLMIADPPIIMMAPQKGAQQKGFRAGDQIGDYKIVSFDSRNIVLEWDGQKFAKPLAELADRDPATAALLGGKVAAPTTPDAVISNTLAPTTPAQSNKLSSNDDKGLGADIGGGMRACNANDSTPAGAVQDGYRKVVSESPFGKVCRWEKIK